MEELRNRHDTSGTATPLSWKPLVLTDEKVIELWTKLQEFPMVFDDFGKGNFEQFVGKLFSPANIFIDIGPGIGLAAGMATRPHMDTILHLVMFDRRLRGRESLFLEIMQFFFKKLELRRMTAIIAEDCQTAINLVKRLGFKTEGLMRDGLLKEGKYVNVHIFGILSSEMANATEHVRNSFGPVAQMSVGT